jgi:Protein of unknown function (DUF2637)
MTAPPTSIMAEAGHTVCPSPGREASDAASDARPDARGVRWRRLASLAGALLVAAIAALASYSHMRGLAVEYGQPAVIADLLPISVDGMMVVATIALGDGRRNRWSAWLAFWTGVTGSVIANVLAAEPSGVARCISAWPAVAFLLVVEVITRGGRSHHHSPSNSASLDTPPQRTGVEPASPVSPPRPARTTPRSAKSGKPARRPIAQTRELAANLRAQFPQITQAELARQLGISATRLRQVERAGARREGSLPTDATDDLQQPREVAA